MNSPDLPPSEQLLFAGHASLDILQTFWPGCLLVLAIIIVLAWLADELIRRQQSAHDVQTIHETVDGGGTPDPAGGIRPKSERSGARGKSPPNCNGILDFRAGDACMSTSRPPACLRQWRIIHRLGIPARGDTRCGSTHRQTNDRCLHRRGHGDLHESEFDLW